MISDYQMLISVCAAGLALVQSGKAKVFTPTELAQHLVVLSDLIAKYSDSDSTVDPLEPLEPSLEDLKVRAFD